MSTREPRPDVLIVGAPKAATSALHVALARHPQIYASPIKEPKYYLCGDAPPPAYSGPGDAHSQQEWVWRRADYEGLFAPAPPRLRTAGEHPLLSLRRRRPPPVGRGAAGGALRRRDPRSGRPGLLQLDAPVGRRPRAGTRFLPRLASRGGADRGGVGTVLALPAAGAVRRAAGGPDLAGSAATASSCSATARWWPSRSRRSIGCAASSASRPIRSSMIPADNSRPFVPVGSALRGARPRHPGRGGRGGVRPAGASGGRRVDPSPPPSSTAVWRSGHAWPLRTAPSW